MLRKVTSVNVLLNGGSQQSLRNLCAFIISRNNSTVTATQSLPDDWENAKPYRDIPGPKPLPVVGNAWRFMPGIGNMHGKAGLIEIAGFLFNNYGHIAKFAGIPGRKDMIFLFDPDDIEKVIRNEGPWPIRESVQSFVHYRTVTRKDIFEGVGGLVTVHGEEWHKFRTKVNQTMMQPRSTKLYIGPIDCVANDFIERIRYIRDENQEMPADFNNEMYKWGLESIAYIALDTRLGSLANDLKPDSEPQKMIDATQILFDTLFILETKVPFWKIISTPTWRSFVKSSDYFITVAMKYINQAMERLKNMPEDSERELTVIEKLLAKDADPKTAVVMALDMMGAGIDTTSNSVIVAMHYLSKYQDKQEILFEEIKKHYPDKNQPLTSENLNELKYLKACIKESMRMSPITAGNMRVITKDLVLRNYQVPKGTYIIMPFSMLSNMEKYYPEANKFIPERWIKGDPQSAKKSHAFVTLPFGFGPRMCIGRRFAELEIETLLTKIIRNFRIEFNHEMKFESKLLYTPVSPLKFKMMDREN